MGDRHMRIASLPPSKLGEHPQHLKHRLSSGCRSIEPLLMKEKPDTLFMEALEYAEQIGE
jgi:hypothetical protein